MFETSLDGPERTPGAPIASFVGPSTQLITINDSEACTLCSCGSEPYSEPEHDDCCAGPGLERFTLVEEELA